jgi:hypothetical protein
MDTTGTSGTTTPGTTGARRPGRDTTALRRITVGTALIAAPALLTLGMLTSPGEGQDLSYDIVGNETLTQVSALALHYSWLVFVPAVIGMMRLTRDRTPLLSALGGGAAILGLINLSGLMVGDFFYLVTVRDRGPEAAEALADDIDGTTSMQLLWTLPSFLALFGLVAIAVALWRAKVAAWWVPAGVLAGFALFMVLVPVAPPVGGAVGPVVLLAVFGTVGVRVLRTGDDAWRRLGSPTVGIASEELTNG